MAGLTVQGDGPLVVREKTFATSPLTLAQALDEMELVGHDFFLFQDAATGQPSVVYRRKAYNYGVIHLAGRRAGPALQRAGPAPCRRTDRAARRRSLGSRTGRA